MRVTLIYNPAAGTDEQLSRNELAGLVRAAGHVIVHQLSHNDSWDEALKNPPTSWRWLAGMARWAK